MKRMAARRIFRVPVTTGTADPPMLPDDLLTEAELAHIMGRTISPLPTRLPTKSTIRAAPPAPPPPPPPPPPSPPAPTTLRRRTVLPAEEKKSKFRNYGLRLAHDRYYWGRTSIAVLDRFIQHVAGEGSEWTRQHPALEIIYDQEEKSLGDEDELTLRCMGDPAIGIDRVRGGTFCEVNIEPHRATIVAMLRTRSNSCYRCGSVGHYASACGVPSTAPRTTVCASPSASPSAAPRRTNARSGSALNYLKEVNRAYRGRVATPYARPQVCHRCGRNNHFVADCFAATHANGHRL